MGACATLIGGDDARRGIKCPTLTLPSPAQAGEGEFFIGVATDVPRKPPLA